ncbi:putative transport protein [Paenibacillus shirakamiensis]|uniref:Transport protein n=2 Tax=Paenibacillus shirakamiensis TaxID=1265935 RepID=A0ABS4JES1_9BACL|nr:putative transport protein [Paenibacillus shirakamiensis]
MELALEHAVKLDALSNYISYTKQKVGSLSYTAVIVTQLRQHIRLNITLNNKKEISNLMMALYKNPTDEDVTNKVLLLLLK